jgi:hypothetical protein
MKITSIVSSQGSTSKATAKVPLGGVLVLLFLMGTACSLGSSTPAPAATGPEATPSSAAPQATSASTNCDNPYFPVVEGATSTWKVSSSAGDAVRTATIKDVGPNRFSVEKKGELSGGRTYTLVDKWSCVDAGLVQYPTGELVAVAKGLNGEVTASVGENEGPTLPRDIQPGDTWIQTFNGEVTGPDSTTNWTVTYNFTAAGLEQVTVPAGTFTAMKLTNLITWPNSGIPDMEMSYWFAQGVGLVKTVFSMEGIDPGTSELASYTLP